MPAAAVWLRGVFQLTYIRHELGRRAGRTILTALGLALGVGLVVGIIGVSQGLDDAQAHALAPLKSVGTDILVTRVIGTTASAATTTTTAPGGGLGAQGDFGGRGGGGFFRGGGRNRDLNTADTNALLKENSNVITDLSKLGKAGTKFTHDFFLSATLQSFPQEAVAQVAKLPGVTSAVPALTQKAEHETGTVPTIVASIKTGGQTYTQTSRPSPLTDAERQAFEQCLASKGITIQRRGGTSTGGPPPGDTGGGGGGGRFLFGGGNPAFESCLPQRYQEFDATFVVPQQTINQIVNPPSTDITNDPYDAAGVDPTNQHSGLVTVDQLTSGRWFGNGATNEVLVSVSYAQKKHLGLGSKISINDGSYTVVGLVNPTLTGSTADVYFPLATLQKLATKQDRVTQILVKAKSASDVPKVAALIEQQLPGATVVTAKSLADQATGSLKDAHDLTSRFGGILALIVLIAAFVIAALLTLSSIAKRVREIGTLRAIGWSKARVVRQLVGETVGIAVVGAAFGLLIGWGAAAAIDHSSTTLTATTTGVSGNTSGSAAAAIGFAQSTAQATQKVALTAPLHPSTLLLGVLFALVGGLIAGLVGSWRAARLAPATALRDIG